MKKYAFLAAALIFAGLFFWQISSFNFSEFHFYGLIDVIFSAFNNNSAGFLNRFLLSMIFLGLYLISLIYVALFFDEKYVLFLYLIFVEFCLYFLLPQFSFIFVGKAFALGNIMLVLYISQRQKRSTKFSFFDLSYKAINQFMRYSLIILCLYNFVLIKNQPFAIPASALNTMVNNLEESLFKNSPFNEEEIAQKTIDFNAKFCEKEDVDMEACLAEMNQFMQTEDLNALSAELGYLSPSELNLNEIVNFKLQEFIEPYEVYLPYILTMIFFSSLYFLVTLLVFIYAFLAEIIYWTLLKTGLIRIDIREIPQEYLV